MAHVIGPGGRGDYMEALSEFVELHKYYPPSSARNGEEGESVLRVTIERDGTVKNMRLLSSSGSSMLDSAWEAVFRDNKLPPFPDDLPGNQQTFYTLAQLPPALPLGGCGHRGACVASACSRAGPGGVLPKRETKAATMSIEAIRNGAPGMWRCPTGLVGATNQAKLSV